MLTLIFITTAAIAAGWLANRIAVPFPIVLVITGIALGFAYSWPGLVLEPHLVLAIVLPAVLYPAAIDTSWRDFRVLRRPIFLLAVGLVTTTTLAVGLTFKALVPDVPWAVAFALGAIVSPPDAVAATAVLKRFQLPRRLVTLLEGESLVNDATGLVLYRFAVAAALTGMFSGAALIGQFALIAVGGALAGIAMGWGTARLQERLHDPMLELAMSLITPFATYWLCEELQLSGVLGVVGAGLYRSRWSHQRAAAAARLSIRTVWHAIIFVTNSLVFILIGIQLPLISAAMMGHQSLSGSKVLALIALLSLVAIVVRFLWIFSATYGVRWLIPAIRQRDPASARVSTLVSWCGMRGVVSLAAALALPEVLPNGSPFPYRDLVILLTYGIVFITLVGQGLTLPPLIRALRLQWDNSGDSETELARVAIRRAAVNAVDRMVAEHGLPTHEAVAVKRYFNSRAGARSGSHAQIDAETRLWLCAVSAQREALIRIWRSGEIGDDVLTRLEREVDLVEARLTRE